MTQSNSAKTSASSADGWSKAFERRRAFDEVRCQWRSVPLPFASFSEHLDRLGYEDSLPQQLSSVYLCAACAMGINAACNALDQIYFPGLRSCVARHGQPSDFVDEVLQQVRERIFRGPSPRIATYRGTGPLAAWLRMVAARIATDSRRAHRQKQRLRVETLQRTEDERDEQSTMVSLFGPGTSRSIVLEKLLNESIAWLNVDERQLLGWYYFDDLNVEQIGGRVAIDRSTVYRRLRQAERCLARRLRELMRTRLGVAERTECSTLLRPLAPYISLQRAFLDPAGSI